MKLFDSWHDFCDYMDFKGYFLDMLIGFIYLGVTLGCFFYGFYCYNLNKVTTATILWSISGVTFILIPIIMIWFHKKFGKKFNI